MTLTSQSSLAQQAGDTPNTNAGEQADAVWQRLRSEAESAFQTEPALSTLLFTAVISQRSFEEAVVRRLAARLAHHALPGEALAAALLKAVEADPSIGEAFRADICAVVERDPAAGRLLEPLLFFKGFAGIQTHRLAHWLWNNGRRDFALYLQSRSSEVFHTDIHPAARFGRGIFLDHATGFVAGETVQIDDDVSILHSVTLGGSGIAAGDRHPKIRSGVLIGAGAQIFGNIEVGAFSKIAAGSLVTHPVPPHSTAVGNPARIVEGAGSDVPAKTMDQMLTNDTYASFTYVI